MNTLANLVLICLLGIIQVTTSVGVFKNQRPSEMAFATWETKEPNLMKDNERLREETGMNKNVYNTLPSYVPVTASVHVPDAVPEVRGSGEGNTVPISNIGDLPFPLASLPIPPDLKIAHPIEKQDYGKEHDVGREMNQKQNYGKDQDVGREMHQKQEEIIQTDTHNAAGGVHRRPGLEPERNQKLKINQRFGKKKAIRDNVKPTLESGGLKIGKELDNKVRRNIYKLNGFDGDKGTVRFLKKVSKPDAGHKEINWIIKIKQIVNDNASDEEIEEEMEVENSDVGENTDNSGEDEVTNNDRNNLLKKMEKTLKLRHLMGHSEKENHDDNNLQKESEIDTNKPVIDYRTSSSDDVETDSAKSAEPDSGNSISIMETTLKKSPENEDMNSAAIEAIKKKVANGDMSFLLRHDLGTEEYDPEKFDPEKLQFLTNVNVNRKIDKQLDNVAERLRDKYKKNLFRRRLNKKKNADEAIKIQEDNEKFNDLIRDGEDDAKLFQNSQDKREVQDVQGSYGVSVDDDNTIIPKEYDTEIDNGIKEIRFPRSTKQRSRVRRLARMDQTTTSNIHPDYRNHEAATKELNVENSRVTKRSSPLEASHKNEGDIKQHGEKEGNTRMETIEGPKLIGMGYIIFNNDQSVKEVNHAGFINPQPTGVSHDSDNNRIFDHSDFAIPRRRPCNNTHMIHMGNEHSMETDHNSGKYRLHPCRGSHRKHHNSRVRTIEHHVVGRTESLQVEADNPDNRLSHEHPSPPPAPSKLLSKNRDEERVSIDSYLHGPFDSQRIENHLPENSNSKHVITGGSRAEDSSGHDREEVAVETFRRESGMTGTHSHHVVHSGTTIHVLVILTILLICFTVIMFAIMKNRSTNGHVREMNSRTALYIPQAKY